MLSKIVLIFISVKLVYAIKGGEPVDQSELPYQVIIASKNVFICSGSILNEQFILTAATCCDGHIAHDFTVVTGENIKYQDEYKGMIPAVRKTSGGICVKRVLKNSISCRTGTRRWTIA